MKPRLPALAARAGKFGAHALLQSRREHGFEGLQGVQRLLLVVQGLKKLFGDEHFVNLLRAEGLDSLPKYLAERIDNLKGVPA